MIRLQSKHLVVGLSLALTMAMVGCQPKEEKPATTGEASPAAEAPATTGEASPSGAAATTQAAGGADVKKGEELYTANCASCHQATGEGMAGTFPPLAGSEFTNGPAKDHITIVLKGKSGPITVKGQQYNGAMPPFAQLTDEEIADIISYERTTWGNKGGMVTADDVKALR
ncbi:MAG TPA: cytochrome c [Stenomitos sp.]